MSADEGQQLPLPIREQPHTHQCQCVVLWHHLGAEDPGGYNACSGEIADPEQPFCLSCEGRHPELTSPHVVTTRSLSAPHQRHQQGD